MKKNILSIRSLFVLQLIASSFILSMETSNNNNNSPEEENFKVSDIRKRFQEQSEQNKTNGKNSLTSSSSSITPETSTSDSSKKTDIIPVQKKRLGLFEGIAYLRSSYEQLEKDIIQKLTDKKFEAEHSSHRDILETTLMNAITAQHTEAVKNILMLLATNYPGVELSDNITDAAYTFFSTPYTSELKITNETLENQELTTQYNNLISQANKLKESINALNETIANNKNNNDTYLSQQKEKLEDLAKPLAALSTLNAKKKAEITTLFNNNGTIEQPIRNTTFDSTMPQFLTQLGSSLNNIPKLPKVKKQPIALALDQK